MNIYHILTIIVKIPPKMKNSIINTTNLIKISKIVVWSPYPEFSKSSTFEIGSKVKTPKVILGKYFVGIKLRSKGLIEVCKAQIIKRFEW